MSGEYDFEPVRGLPASLPAGEALIWQGGPDWRSLAIRAFHLKKVVLYFGLLGVWSIVSAWVDGRKLGEALVGAAWIVPVAIAAVTPLAVLAWLIARTTVYSITSKRVVMRIGVALPIAINIPFKSIESIGLRRHRDGSGDLPASIAKGYKLAFLVLWPHVRPWHIRHPQPMLRCVPDCERVAGILAQAISGDAAQSRQPMTEPVREPDRRPTAVVPASAAAA